MEWNRKTAIITGASSGIGQALAHELARAGLNLGLLARRGDRLVKVAREAESLGVKALCVPCDVTEITQVQSAVSAVEDALGPIDLAIANAGIGYPVPVSDFDAGKAAEIYRVNVFGMLNLFSAVIPGMVERRYGHLVGISSLSAYSSFPEASSYCASKSAMSAQLEGLRRELIDTGLTVTTICPGFIRTPLTEANHFPMPFLMDVDEAAIKIAMAIKKRRKVYNFPWQTYWLVRFGQWLPDAFLAKVSKPKNGRPYKG